VDEEVARRVRHAVRIACTLLLTVGCGAYLLWKIDLGRTADVLANVRLHYFVAAVALLFATIVPLAWRWRLLLRARGIDDGLRWLVRAYLVSYAAGQVLPTSLGGDATRIYETSRRHPGQGGAVAGSVILERVIGGAATLVLAAAGFAVALGRYDVGAYLWFELAFVVVAVIVCVLLFSRSVRPFLARLAPALRRVWLERPVRAVYEEMHAYRADRTVLAVTFGATLGVQAVRILTIWLAAKAVGVDLSPRPFFVMGPLLFLVMLVPFTINGFALRESFFVSFLGNLGVGADQAFATGFLFFLLSTGLGLPGAAILLWQSARGGGARPAAGAATPD
jgi:glycosyltransferase 2 family protein